MSFNQRIGAAALVVAATLAFSRAAWPLGLGDATVESYLGQPLQARIDLISQPSDDLTTVTAKLASAEDYELIGASLDSIPVPIRFSIEDIDGDAYLRATSNLTIDHPVLRLIVEVNWSSGRMLREYTLFLDPPTVADAAPPPPRIDRRETATAARPERPAATSPPAEVAEAPAKAPPARPSAAAAAGQEYGPVRSGETLWRIASDWSRDTGLGINQVMIAIQRENPGAFSRGNINLLKRGVILRMPSVEAVEDISLASARREVEAQQERLAARRAEARATSPAAPVLVQENAPPAPAEEPAAPTPQAPTPAETVEASAEPTEEAEATAPEPAMAEEMPEEAAVASEEPRDQLELVPPSSSTPSESAEAAEGAADGAETGGAEQLRESLARTEEELINQRQQNDYLEERIRELESRLQEAEKEGVSDADLANMQDRLREQRQASPAGSDQPWYTRTMVWLLVVLVLVVALVGWLFSRRGRSHDLGGLAPKPKDSLEEIRGEAEDVLRTLGDEPAAESLAEEPPQEPAREPVQEPDDDTETKVVQFPGGDEDAEVLDEESSDPEIQLDLARAYISMGDKEAARVILEEVISNGTETQRTEGRKMLDLLRSP